MKKKKIKKRTKRILITVLILCVIGGIAGGIAAKKHKQKKIAQIKPIEKQENRKKPEEKKKTKKSVIGNTYVNERFQEYYKFISDKKVIQGGTGPESPGDESFSFYYTIDEVYDWFTVYNYDPKKKTNKNEYNYKDEHTFEWRGDDILIDGLLYKKQKEKKPEKNSIVGKTYEFDGNYYQFSSEKTGMNRARGSDDPFWFYYKIDGDVLILYINDPDGEDFDPINEKSFEHKFSVSEDGKTITVDGYKYKETDEIPENTETDTEKCEGTD